MVNFIFIQILIEQSVNSREAELGLHCLSMFHKKETMRILVKVTFGLEHEVLVLIILCAKVSFKSPY